MSQKNKKIIYSLTIVVVLAYGSFKLYRLSVFERITKLIVNSACEQNGLDDYFHNEPLATGEQVYLKASRSLNRFGLDREHLAEYGNKTKKEIFKTAKTIGQKIFQTCGSPKRTVEKARYFTALILSQSTEK